RGGLTTQEAIDPPCLACAETPCCTWLPLQTFELHGLMDVDYVRYLLNFESVNVGVAASGTWSAYLFRDCRNLDENHACRVHGTDLQPSVCKHYNPYSCWYRKSVVPEVGEDFATVDRGRFAVFEEGLLFDERRMLVQKPSWDELVERFAAMPLEPSPSVPPAADPVFAAWEREVVARAAPVASVPGRLPSLGRR